MSVPFFVANSYSISEFITRKYSTSFSLATSLLEKPQREAIYAVYGFVRLADEIVDSFHNFDQPFLLNKLDEELAYALEKGISTNPILTAFADTVVKYQIEKPHIQAFMDSMRFDLSKKKYTTTKELNRYIYGSADVVGLICLKIFCNGDTALYQQLEAPAQKLGSAFQKVNFLRDLKSDMEELGRRYFPEISEEALNETHKKRIEASIEADFKEAWEGIKQLPNRSKLAVALAYKYYNGLLKKIKKTPAKKLLAQRIRLSNFRKYLIILRVYVQYQTNRI
ncbi:MAG: phytoene synthase [Bacteroidetes bacterium]|nr:MAG: phytoene synthase [Bacteroidota bacterium]PIE88059.1 MAG: phytoene synthase [Bacteroidota bacterium]